MPTIMILMITERIIIIINYVFVIKNKTNILFSKK